MTDEKPIRLLIADDDTPVRRRLSEVLSWEAGIEVVGQAADGTEAVRLAGELRPDVVLMDFVMPRLNGLQATRQITAQTPGVGVVGLSTHDGDTAARPMHAAGAAAYVTKLAPLDELVRAIHAAAGR